ncbi:hypothetical protein E4U41_002562 [Claviceps citrina]|nr:hypothetical protein E4U41_002562 [Claviceps citrina]
MNPCADDFTPLSTPDMESSSSVATLDEDVGSSGPAAIRFMSPEADKTHRAVEPPLAYDLEQPSSPLQLPLLHHITPYAFPPPGCQFASHQVWGVHPWYNPVIVSGRGCGTSPQPLHGPSPFSPMNPFFVHMSSLQPHAIASPDALIQRPSADEPAPNGQLGLDRVPRQFTHDKLRGNIKRRDFEYLVLGLKSLACTPSNARRCAIGNHPSGLRKTTKKYRGKTASVLGPTTQDLCQHDHRQASGSSVDMPSSLPCPATSANSSPLWSHYALPLMDNGPSSPDVLSLDTLKLSDSFLSNNFSISDDSHSLHDQPRLRNTCRNVSPQSSVQEQSLRPVEAQQLMELGAAESLTQSDLSQDTGSLLVADTASSKTLPATAAARPSHPKSPPRFSDMHLQAKQEPDHSGVMTLEQQRDSESCISASVRTQQQDREPLTPRLDQVQKQSMPRSDNESRSSTLSASLDRRAFSTLLQEPAAASSARNVTESGSWSQSKRWTSQTSKERMMFQKMVTNLFHLSANNSPFVPQSPAELTAFRAEMADIKKKRLSREVGWRVATIERKRARSKDSGEEAAKLVPLLLGRQFNDTLSPVLASRNCFTEHISRDDAQWVPWPSLPEFKDEGDKRSLQHGRRFPLPRLRINAQPVAIVSESGYKAPWQMKTVKIDTRFIHPASDFVCQSNFPYEPPLTEYDIPYHLLREIQAMEEELDD